MKLFEITYYSVDNGCLCPETSWYVEFESADKAMEKCSYLTSKKKGAIFMCKPIDIISYDNFTDEFIKSELELL